MRRLRLRHLFLATTCLAAPAAAQEAVVLDNVVIRGSSYETEGTGSLTTDQVSVGEKEVRDIREIPMSTTVITDAQIDDRGFTSLDTALQKTPGMRVLTNDSGRSSLYVRGFEMDYLYFNGLPAPLSSIYGTQPDLSIVDHVEILKGPNGLFIGTGEPGGAVNMSLKRAQRDFGGYVSLSGQSFGRGRAEADVTGSLNDSGTLRGRAVFAYEDGDGFVDQQENGVAQAYGTVAWDVTPDTELTFTISHMERDITPFNGLPTDGDLDLLDVDRSTTTMADWNEFENTVDDYLLELRHELDGGGFLKFSGRYSTRDVDFLYAYGASAADEDDTVTNLSWLAQQYKEDSLALDAYASLPFDFGRTTGNLIVGADYQKVESRLYSARGTIAGSFDLNDWDVSDVDRPDVSWSSREETETERYGLYSQLRVSPLEGLNLIAGGRFTWYDQTATDLDTNEETDDIGENGRFTPFGGLTWDVTEQVTLYASYTSIFQPQTETDVNDRLIDPAEGHQVEIGAKGRFFDGLNASLALFQLEEDNRAEVETGTRDYYAMDVESRGVELELSGEVLPGWQVFGGYTYTEMKYTDGPMDGDVFKGYTPEHMVQLWSSYDFGPGALDRLTLGGGLTYMSDFKSVSSTGEIEAPGYTVVDLMARWEVTEQSDIRLSVNNVFDETYYSRVGGPSVFNFYGEPRNLELAFTQRF
ncbi:TonB-dependent siderophore receptor [Mangrovicoccus algicola]|uniref:TonB-dependent siderophore receptor n=1 Tax=Mangrovicoccus algicola TaxID=2771008 RepID=UPI002EDA98D3